jgi:hypothetical protein
MIARNVAGKLGQEGLASLLPQTLSRIWPSGRSWSVLSGLSPDESCHPARPASAHVHKSRVKCDRLGPCLSVDECINNFGWHIKMPDRDIAAEAGPRKRQKSSHTSITGGGEPVEQASHPADTFGPPTRAGLACEACRLRKTRCVGFPTCNWCQQRSKPCVRGGNHPISP